MFQEFEQRNFSIITETETIFTPFPLKFEPQEGKRRKVKGFLEMGVKGFWFP